MAINRVPKKKNFTNISNVVFNSGLSFRAIGVLTFILSKPDNWSVSVSHLVKTSKGTGNPIGRDTVYSTLSELIEKGYVQRVKKRSKDGTFKGYDYDFNDEPVTAEPFTAEPYTAKPTLINTDIKTNTDNKQMSSQQADTTFDFEQVKQAYNEFANSNGLATIRAVTDKKKREVRSAYNIYCKIRKATGKEPVSGNEFVSGYLAIVQSLMTDFHTGQNKNKWKAGFDYFFATDIVENVLNENKLSRK